MFDVMFCINTTIIVSSVLDELLWFAADTSLVLLRLAGGSAPANLFFWSHPYVLPTKIVYKNMLRIKHATIHA